MNRTNFSQYQVGVFFELHCVNQDTWSILYSLQKNHHSEAPELAEARANLYGPRLLDLPVARARRGLT
jgi:hypothetical protein